MNIVKAEIELDQGMLRELEGVLRRRARPSRGSRVRPASPGLERVNFLMNEGEGRIRQAYGAKYDRLQALKLKYDPDNLFHLNQNIPPKQDRV